MSRPCQRVPKCSHRKLCGKNTPSKPWPSKYRASPCQPGELHDECFRGQILDGLDTANQDCVLYFRGQILDGLETANQDCVLYVNERKSATDIDKFMDLFQTPCKMDDKVNLKQDWVRDHFLDFVEDLEVSAELSSELERTTRGQSCNPNWLKARTVILTASNFGTLCKMRETTQPDATLRRLCGYSPTPKTVAMLYGLKMESRARKQQHQKTCTPGGTKVVGVTNVGLVVSPEWPYLGASLDGLVTCPQCGTGGLEIKCPYKFRSALAGRFINHIF